MANYATRLLGQTVFYTLATLGLIRCIINDLIHGGKPLNKQQKGHLTRGKTPAAFDEYC
jgi:hypothetical protein